MRSTEPERLTFQPVETLLACPVCHGRVERSGPLLLCAAATCGFAGEIRDGIVCLHPGGDAPSFFDRHYGEMLASSDEPGSHGIFYAEQGALIGARLARSSVTLDIGCGPRLSYGRPPGLVIGLDSSWESLRSNRGLDVRIYGLATRIPLPRASVDTVVCLYALHHLTGRTRRATEALVRLALREIARVVTPDGVVIVCEVSPWWPVWALERWGWTAAKAVLGNALDVFFWRRQALEGLAAAVFPPDTRCDYRRVTVPPWTTFPFLATRHRLRLPRWMYPFEVGVYHWSLGA
mgnify:FL=1